MTDSSTVPPAPDHPAVEADEPKPWYKRWWGITAIVLGVLMLFGLTTDPVEDTTDTVAQTDAAPTEADDADDTDAEATPTPTPTPTPDPEPTPTPSPTPTPTPTQTPTPEPEPEPTPEPEPEVAFEPQVFEGAGDDIVNVVVPDDMPAILLISHSGPSNFQVSAFGGGGERIGGLVNEIGNYNGTRPVNFARGAVRELDIVAGGAWRIELRPVTDAPSVDDSGASAGTGDAVILVLRGGRAEMTHDGTSNFQVTAWGGRRQGLVNEIGAYSGTVRVPEDTLIFEIVADGAWRVDLDG